MIITKLPNTEQSYKGKGKTHKSTNRQNQSTTGKLGKPQWPWLGTGISKEMVDWIKILRRQSSRFILGQLVIYSNTMSFIVYINNAVIKLPIYLNSYMRIGDQIINIPK